MYALVQMRLRYRKTETAIIDGVTVINRAPEFVKDIYMKISCVCVETENVTCILSYFARTNLAYRHQIVEGINSLLSHRETTFNLSMMHVNRLRNCYVVT